MDGNETERAGKSISRREALKKGALIGGTVLWVAPAVQTIGMSKAFAQTASAGAHTSTGGGSTPHSGSTDLNSGSSHLTLALTGSNSQHVAELGLAATAAGVALVALSKAKDKRSDDED